MADESVRTASPGSGDPGAARRDVYAVAADYVERNAEALVASWIVWVKERVQTTAVTALPERALRNHVPPVLQSLARYLRNPIELAREELLGHLRLHGQIRRDQGYSLQEVLAEFDGLADLVTRGVNRALRRDVEAVSAEDVLEVSTRLAAGLRSVSFITVGTYSESDDQRANALSASLEEFARAISHEMRNPLNTLSLSLQLLRRDASDLETHVGVMEAAVQRAASLLDTIHTLAIAEGARAGKRLVSLEQAVRRTIEDFVDEAHAKEIDVHVVEPLPDVLVESMLLYVVLANVIGNAVKYHDPEKTARRIEVSATLIEEEHDSGFCEIRVEDNGIGIPEELLPRVTQKGFRAHPDRAQGTGLGLFIVQDAVHSRGGAIAIESVDGGGTTVSVRVRCLQDSADALTAGAFTVQSLMGEMVQPLSASEPPELPDDAEEIV